MCLEFDFTYAMQISSRSVNPLSYFIYIYMYSFIFNNSTGKQFLLSQAFTNFHNLRRQGGPWHNLRRKLWKFVKAWDNKNCFPVELLKINEYEPRKSLISINQIYIYIYIYENYNRNYLKK